MLIVIVCAGISLPMCAQQSIPRGRLVQKSQYFSIETDLDAGQTAVIAGYLDAAIQLFQEYLDGEESEWPLRIRLFASYDAFLGVLSTFPAEYNLRNRQDFLFLLNSKRPEMSVLLMYPRDAENLMRASLLKNSFLHYVFSVAPEMSPWLREGLALYFELAHWNEVNRSFELIPNHLYLDRLQLIRETEPLSIEELTSMNNDTLESSLESGLAHSWAIVNYLMMENTEVLQSIIIRELLGESRIHPELLALTESIEAYFNAPGFNALMAAGRHAVSESLYDEAFSLFERARTVNPTAWSAVYYLGLSAFHIEAYDQARDLYEEALAMGAEEALIYYALGILAIQENDFARAESYFILVEERDRQRFSRLINEQRRKMETQQLLQ